MLRFSTQNLILRLITESDLLVIHELQSIPEVDRYNTLGIPKDFEETKKVMAPLLEANKKKKSITTHLPLNKKKIISLWD